MSIEASKRIIPAVYSKELRKQLDFEKFPTRTSRCRPGSEHSRNYAGVFASKKR